MSDAPFRGTADPLGPLVQRHAVVRLRPSAQPAVRLGIPAGLLALAGATALLGSPIDAALYAGPVVVATTAAALAARPRRQRCTVDHHAYGLRVDGTDHRIDALGAVTLGFTADEPRWRASWLAVDTGGDAPLMVGGRRAVRALAAALEHALGPRHHAAAEAVLDRSPPITCGPCTLWADGLVSGTRRIPWREVGPARRARGHVIIDTPIGSVEVPIASVPNPWVIEAVVAARGRGAP